MITNESESPIIYLDSNFFSERVVLDQYMEYYLIVLVVLFKYFKKNI